MLERVMGIKSLGEAEDKNSSESKYTQNHRVKKDISAKSKEDGRSD